ncbi:hypothetical protein DB346_00055 [Verrucomicrobia bacterium LW23]|nr:hypothetical protein DB346_00055 [Verrucomicrobia bacterium LW23]
MSSLPPTPRPDDDAGTPVTPAAPVDALRPAALRESAPQAAPGATVSSVSDVAPTAAPASPAAPAQPGKPRGGRRRNILPRAWILRSGATFRALRERGRRIHGPHFTLTIAIPASAALAPAAGAVATDARGKGGTPGPIRDSKGKGRSRELVAFSTARRVGNAVTRNRVRRLMREVHRQFLSRPGQDRVLLWSAKPSAATLSFAELHAAMEVLWKRVTRWNAPEPTRGSTAADKTDKAGTESQNPRKSFGAPDKTCDDSRAT